MNRPGAVGWRASLLAVALLCGGVRGATAQDTAAPGPAALMSGLSARLFAQLARDRPALRRDPSHATALVDALLGPSFDQDYLARLVLGSRWQTASDEQRRRFAAALYATLLSTYAAAVVEWTPEGFHMLPLQDPGESPQVVVRTEVLAPGGNVTHVDYRLHRTPAGWKIFDVVVSGVSYAHSYHDDIAAELLHKGIDAVIARLERPPGR